MYKVMLVDDEPFILEGLRQIINWDEHKLVIAAVANQGEKAFEMIKGLAIDILITDIQMPNVNGLELIMRIREEGLDIKCIILSGYDNFDYIKKALPLGIENYLLKPINEVELSSTLLTTVKKLDNEIHEKFKLRENAGILRENILYRWITNVIEPAELKERAAIVQIDLKCPTYLIGFMRIVNAGIGSFIKSDPVLTFAVLNIANEVIGSFGKSIVISNHKSDFIFLFASHTLLEDKQEIEQLIKASIENISKILKINVFAALGSLQSDFRNVYKSYEHAYSIIDYSLISEPNTIIDFDAARPSYEDHQITIQTDMEQLRIHIINHDKQSSFDFMDNFFERLRQVPNMNPVLLQNISIDLLYNHTYHLNQRIKIDKNVIFNSTDHFLQEIFEIHDRLELINWVKQFVSNLIDQLLLKKEADSNPLINRVLNYMESHYATDISLKMLSAHFNVNTAYLGQLFKMEVGGMFTNYLNQLRINKAKDLLLTTELPASEIALQVGYTNANYFYNIFKKLTGQYPTKYKREML
ncbi:response regulator [Paenibacillus psychroresistens]|uniref:Response regulator n=1 Tax=Paenibacillus psychroresistens TaxID=1778678 RepID=A0A6B8RG20_9BACL|nr:response regulator [Paenibacillus psychroresistens]QGQ94452.1 response regulator [Paenibacillus psychroresistens]